MWVRTGIIVFTKIKSKVCENMCNEHMVLIMQLCQCPECWTLGLDHHKPKPYICGAHLVQNQHIYDLL